MLIDYRKRIRPFLKRLNSHFKKIFYIVSQVSIKVIYQFISSCTFDTDYQIFNKEMDTKFN